MGYRSSVTFVMNREKWESLRVLTPETIPEILMDNESYDHFGNRGSDMVEWVFHSIKWYEGYSHIIEFNEWIMNLEYEDYHFLRLGEEFEDYEESGNLHSHYAFTLEIGDFL